jgi:Ni/Fe-hydrogenase 1 B-type cytochrome subunit
MSEVFTTEEHPLPAVLMHWAHLVSFITLAVTGLLIYYTPSGWNMGVVRNFHFVMMFVFFYTAIIRIYWAFFGRGSANTGKTTVIPDWKHFSPEAANKGKLIEWVKYYLFISKYKPRTSKYGTLQKLSYAVVFPVLIFGMALTGFSLWEPTQPYLGWFIDLFSSLDVLRTVHLLGCWLMLMVFMIHLYLVLFEEPGQAATMLFRFVPEKHRPASMRNTGGVTEAAKH